MDAIAQSLLTAQSKAEALFREVVESGMIAGLAVPAGWEFGAMTAGHLIGRRFGALLSTCITGWIPNHEEIAR